MEAVYSLDSFDDSSGTAIYAAGDFPSIGGTPASNIARWNGSIWSALGSGTDRVIDALAGFDDGTGGGPDLYAGGSVVQAGGLLSWAVAEWRGCDPAVPFCFSDGTS